jgi:hypothetical protein
MLIVGSIALLALLVSHASASKYDVLDWQGPIDITARSSPAVDVDYLNTTAHLHRLSKRASITDFEIQGRIVDCLMQNTQDGANFVKANNPWLANKPIVATYTHSPQDILNAGWMWEQFFEVDYSDGLATTQDARNAIGGGATNPQNLVGIRLFWQGPTVPTTTGRTWVSERHRGRLQRWKGN